MTAGVGVDRLDECSRSYLQWMRLRTRRVASMRPLVGVHEPGLEYGWCRRPRQRGARRALSGTAGLGLDSLIEILASTVVV